HVKGGDHGQVELYMLKVEHMVKLSAKHAEGGTHRPVKLSMIKYAEGGANGRAVTPQTAFRMID
ncbi:hypothetical protein A2U01_0048605, partial [Trifolium medium]|nr:hypothetical protein [Trifolium medium]